MDDTRVAKRYARALFSAAKREGVVSGVDEDLKAVTTAFRDSSGFRVFIESPQTDDAQKTGLMEKVFGDRVTPLTMSALRLLIKKRRDNEIFALQKEFAELRRQMDGVTKATVTSSTPLDKGQQDAVVAKIAAKTGRTVEAEFDIDTSLIGGVKVIYDDYILDGSVRGQLDRMKETLLYDLLKQA
ncbi:MAG: ATP synthase F1 subunit delta [Fimbriimonadaceae bacterium]|nr:ATP synthase F1 subunit delta [Fimbriimonadaceae bacterium]